MIRAASSAAKGEAPKDISAFLCRMGDMGNIPRQEKKFKVKDCMFYSEKFVEVAAELEKKKK